MIEKTDCPEVIEAYRAEKRYGPRFGPAAVAFLDTALELAEDPALAVGLSLAEAFRDQCTFGHAMMPGGVRADWRDDVQRDVTAQIADISDFLAANVTGRTSGEYLEQISDLYERTH